MKNMYTEDDTFEALCRIPQAQVREKLDEFGLWFEDYRESHYMAIAYNKKMKFWNKLKKFVGLATYYKEANNPLILLDVEKKLQGTGWTLESYAEVIDKPILEQLATIHAIKVKRRTYMLCAYILCLVLGVQIAVMLSVVWTQGLLVGLQLSNIITITYHWVADKYFPYPSYHYRYV